MKKQILFRVLIWVSICALLFIWLNANFSYNYFFVEQTRMFLYTSAYAYDTIFQPLGLVTYISSFIVQFYKIPLVGALISVIFFLIISVGIRLMLPLRGKLLPLLPIVTLPAILLLFAETDSYYHLEGTLSLAIVVIALNFYIRISRPLVRCIVMLSGSLFLLFIAGPAFLPFIISCVLFDLISCTSRYRLYSLCTAVVTSVFIFVLYRMALIGVPNMAFMPDAYVSPLISASWPLYAGWITMFLLFVILQLCRSYGKEWKRMWHHIFLIIQVLLVGFTFHYSYIHFFNKKDYLVKQLDYMTQNSQWDELLALNLPSGNNLLYCCYQNYALSQKGILADKALCYPQTGSRGLILPFSHSSLVLNLMDKVHFSIGNVALSQRFAFEALVVSEFEASPNMLLRLIQTNIIIGEYNVAEKYISLLENTLFYKDIAHSYRSLLYDEEKINNHPVLGSKRKSKAATDGFASMDDVKRDLFQIYASNPTNTVTFDYLCMYLLFSRSLDEFAQLIDISQAYEVIEVYPTHAQEALLMYYQDDPLRLKDFNLSAHVVERFEDFVQVYRRTQVDPRAFNLLKSKFQDTYWYYYFFAKMN